MVSEEGCVIDCYVIIGSFKFYIWFLWYLNKWFILSMEVEDGCLVIGKVVGEGVSGVCCLRGRWCCWIYCDVECILLIS